MIAFDWQYAWRVLPELGRGLVVTIEATVLGMLLAVSFGLALALMRRAQSRIIAWPAAAFVEFVRSTPLLVQLYFLFYVLPDAGLRMSPLATGVLALGLHYATYCSEVYRAGLEGIPKEQWEAATALNLGPWRTMVAVILPQAIPPVIPALGNYLIAMFKDTPLLSAITVLEMLQRAKIVSAESFRYVEPLTIVGLAFLLVSLIAAIPVRRLERNLRTPGA
jgi:polar amino acid transport system permease protein